VIDKEISAWGMVAMVEFRGSLPAVRMIVFASYNKRCQANLVRWQKVQVQPICRLR
jgi:hypothetical protein